MALKDHVVDSTKFSEEQIEAIISGRVKYDPTRKSVVLLPLAQKLSVRGKILLYLTALKGWRFVVAKDTPSESASPQEIGQAIGVHGGTVRPTLRELTGRRIIIGERGHYHVPTHNLGDIQGLLTSQDSDVTARQTAKHAPKKIKHVSSAEAVSKVLDASKTPLSSKRSKPSNGKPTLAEGFQKLLQEKWFVGGKTLNQLKDKLDEMTIFPPMSQLPWHLLRAYRNGLLDRKKETIDGKKVLVYTQR